MAHAIRHLNDHRWIRYRPNNGDIGRFMPWHAAAEHRLDIAFLRHELAKQHPGPTVVVSHHAPHPASIQPQHQGSALSPTFLTHLSDLINTWQPALWVHGHDHAPHDYQVGMTRVFSNQAGKPKAGQREKDGFRPGCVIQI
jgi:Icc-related predicted phosphoesterase